MFCLDLCGGVGGVLRFVACGLVWFLVVVVWRFVATSRCGVALDFCGCFAVVCLVVGLLALFSFAGFPACLGCDCGCGVAFGWLFWVVVALLASSCGCRLVIVCV